MTKTKPIIYVSINSLGVDIVRRERGIKPYRNVSETAYRRALRVIGGLPKKRLGGIHLYAYLRD